MRLYHGTAAWDAIRRDGIMPDPETKTFGEDELGLESLGGAYLANCVEAPGFYAVKSVNSNGWVHGYDPCFFVVEMDEDALLPDEDKIGAVVRRCVEDMVQTERWNADATIERLAAVKEEFIRRLRLALWIADGGDDQVLWEGAEAFIRRYTEDGWPEAGGREAATRLCEAAKATLDEAWFDDAFDGVYWFTCRTMERISLTGSRRAVLGGARLSMGEKGMAIVDIERFGDVTDEEIEIFKASAVKYFREIEGVDVDDRTEEAHRMEFVRP